MKTSRLEGFSDGVLAIIITIMVLEMKVPEGVSIKSLKSIIPIFITYVFSFIYVGIYWNNHHHLIHAVKEVNGKILWANMVLLFWLSLFPFATGWMGRNYLSSYPVAVYGFVLLMAAIAFKILVYFVISNEGEESILSKIMDNDWKGTISITAYSIGVIFAFITPYVSIALYVLVAGMWFIPDKKIEKSLK